MPDRKFRWSKDGGAIWTYEDGEVPFLLSGILGTDSIIVEPIGDQVSIAGGAEPSDPINTVTQIGNSAIMPLNRAASTGTSNNRTTGKFFRNGWKAVNKVRLMYCNAYLTSAGAEATDVGNLKVWSSIRYNGAIYPVTFNGQAGKVLAPGEVAISDEIAGLTIAAGAGYIVITGDQNTATEFRPMQYYLENDRGEFYAASNSEATMLAHVSGATVLPANGDGWTGYGPMGVLAATVDASNVECVVVLHDSIGDGTAELNAGGDADGNRGYIRRAFGTKQRYCWTLGRAGATVANCMPVNSPIRVAAFAYATSLIDQLGENSLTVSNIHTVWEAHLDAWKAVNDVPAVAAKVMCKTASPTDGWTTKVGQTVAAADQYVAAVTMPSRPRFSLRLHQDALVSSGKLIGVIDGLPLVKSPTAQDLWNTPAETAPAVLANDAIHPTLAGHLAMVPAVVAAIDAGWFDVVAA